MLYLYRHGETEENRQHILQGLMPGTLSREGIEQIHQSVEHICPLNIDLILCSDIERCRQTASIINGYLNLPIEYPTLLRERDWGSATGMIVDGVTRIKLPDDVETIAQMQQRASSFLEYVKHHYADTNVLAISHGLFCRQIQATYHNVQIADIERMSNCEIRRLDLNQYRTNT